MQQMAQVAQEQGKILAPLKDDLLLAESGLDSLGFAVLVARLDDTLGIDPFTAAGDTSFPVTFAEFVRIYKNGAPEGAVAARPRCEDSNAAILLRS
jgi:hypothetical protein